MASLMAGGLHVLFQYLHLPAFWNYEYVAMFLLSFIIDEYLFLFEYYVVSVL